MKALLCHRTARSWRKRQRGAVAILVGLTLVVLVGFIGLALDGGHLYLTKTELQNAADACALAASFELTPDTSGSISGPAFGRADLAGRYVAQKNRVDFQNTTISGGEIVVEFGESLSTGGTWRTKDAATGNSEFVRCTITRGGIATWFMQVLGFGDQTVAALATASLASGPVNCAIPLGVCAKSLDKFAVNGWGLAYGEWVSGRFSSGGGSTGSYNWIDFDPPYGGVGGEDGLAAQLSGNGYCSLSLIDKVGEPGNLGNAAAKAWNTRFGLYQGSYNIDKNRPDYTGYAYTTKNFTAGSSAIDDYRARGPDRETGRSPYSTSAPGVAAGNTLTGLSVANGYKASTGGQHDGVGTNRRLVVAPIVNCANWEESNHSTPILDWACVLLLTPIASPGDNISMEFRGVTSSSLNSCSTAGIPGGTGSEGTPVPALRQ